MRTVVLAKRLIDGTGTEPISNVAIVIEEGFIRDVLPQDRYVAQDADQTLDCTDLTVLPGLIDAHVHLCFNAAATTAEVLEPLFEDDDMSLALQAGENARRALCAGITTVRDCGGKNLVVLAVRDAIDAGWLPGPRVLASGMPITTTAGHLHYLGTRADNASEVTKAVRRLCETGVDFIKICATGGRMTRGSNMFMPQYTTDELRAAAVEAHRLERRIAAHVLNREGVLRSVLAGIDTIEHCRWHTPDGGFSMDEGTLDSMKHKGIFACFNMSGIVLQHLDLLTEQVDGKAITQDAKRLPKNLENRFETEREMYHRGVPVAITSDAGVTGTPIEGFYRSIHAAVTFLRLPPVKAVQAVTERAAAALGLSTLGTVKTGKLADLLAVKGDPATDVRDLQHVDTVIRGGRIVVRHGALISTKRT